MNESRVASEREASTLQLMDPAVLAALKKGVEVTKSGSLTSRMKAKIGKNRGRVLRLDDDGHSLMWASKIGFKHASLLSIHRVRLIESSRLIKIDAGEKKIEFEFHSLEDFNTFGRGFQRLVTLYQKESTLDAATLHMRALWLKADKDANGTISREEFFQFMTDHLNVDAKNSKTVAELMATHDLDRSGSLDFEEFCSALRSVGSHVAQIRHIFDKHSGQDGIMTADDLTEFLMEVQGFQVKHAARKEARRICDSHGSKLGNENALIFGSFVTYLLSTENSALDPTENNIHMDMSQPLAHYYISSSHNTYLEGNQLTGDASLDAYETAIKLGARCVELDVWDGDKGEPLITHGHTLTGDISLEEVLRTVKQFAFEQSEYPFILSMENHCSVKQQLRMAELLVAILGDSIYRWGGEKLNSLPSPEGLKRKIVIKCKVKDTTPIELERLVFLIGSKFQQWSVSLGLRLNEMHSFSESKVIDFIKGDKDVEVDSARKLIGYNTRHISRIYPKGTRVTSDNYDPALAWDHGSQIVALNFQSLNNAMLSNWALFSQNGGCGYVRKPAHLCGSTSESTSDEPVSLTVRVIMGFNLPTYAVESKKAQTMCPYVVVEASGAWMRSLKGKRPEVMRTATVKDNDFDPLFSTEKNPCSFRLDIKSKATGSVHFWIKNDVLGKDDIVAVAAVPTAALRTGYRFVNLRDYRGRPLRSFRGLLCHFSFDSAASS